VQASLNQIINRLHVCLNELLYLFEIHEYYQAAGIWLN
jgi:hypothetical protein